MRQFIHANKMNEITERKEYIASRNLVHPVASLLLKLTSSNFHFSLMMLKPRLGRLWAVAQILPIHISLGQLVVLSINCVQFYDAGSSPIAAYLFYHLSKSKCSAPPCPLALSIKGSSQIILSLSLLFFNPY